MKGLISDLVHLWKADMAARGLCAALKRSQGKAQEEPATIRA